MEEFDFLPLLPIQLFKPGLAQDILREAFHIRLPQDCVSALLRHTVLPPTCLHVARQKLPTVPTRDVDNVPPPFTGEGQDVAQLFPPPVLIHGGLIDLAFAGVGVEPGATSVRPHFDPDMVGEVQHVTGVVAQGTAISAKEIRIFSAPPPAGLEHSPGRIVSWKRRGLIPTAGATVHFNARSPSLPFISGLRTSRPSGLGIGVTTLDARGLVHPGHHIPLKVQSEALEQQVILLVLGIVVIGVRGLLFLASTSSTIWHELVKGYRCPYLIEQGLILFPSLHRGES